MNLTPKNKDIFKIIEQLAPKEKAYDWDNVGMLIGSYDAPVQRIMVTLDVLESVADEAIEKDVDLIIAHHPLIFKPIKQINLQTPEGRTISKLIKNNITVYAAHTNLDVVDFGVNDMLAKALNLEQTKVLVKEGRSTLYKYAVNVPTTHAPHLKEVLGQSGAGVQGDYSHCSFEVEGVGSFRPLEGATPFIGEVGKSTEVAEVKIEAIVSEKDIAKVIERVKNAHPYEEPAFDVIKLENAGDVYGIGRIGTIKQPKQLQAYAQEVKEQLNLDHVRVIGNLEQEIKKVAVLGGSGEKYIAKAQSAGADVLITGDITFHPAQNALESGMAVIDAGHYIEAIMKVQLMHYLKGKLTGTEVQCMVSETVTDPFQYM